MKSQVKTKNIEANWWLLYVIYFVSGIELFRKLSLNEMLNMSTLWISIWTIIIGTTGLSHILFEHRLKEIILNNPNESYQRTHYLCNLITSVLFYLIVKIISNARSVNHFVVPLKTNNSYKIINKSASVDHIEFFLLISFFVYILLLEIICRIEEKHYFSTNKNIFTEKEKMSFQYSHFARIFGAILLLFSMLFYLVVISSSNLMISVGILALIILSIYWRFGYEYIFNLDKGLNRSNTSSHSKL